MHTLQYVNSLDTLTLNVAIFYVICFLYLKPNKKKTGKKYDKI